MRLPGWVIVMTSPEDGWVTGIKDGHYSKTMQIGSCTVTVHRPILDDQERAKREEAVIQALTHFGRAVYGTNK